MNTLTTIDDKVLFKSKQDLNFPRYFIYDENRRQVSFTKGRHGVYETHIVMQSEDAGETWLPDTDYPLRQHIHSISRLKDSTLVGWGELSIFEPNPFDKYYEVAISHNNGKTWGVERMPIAESRIAMRPFGRLVQLQDGTLIQPAYAIAANEKKDTQYVFAKKPGENWWRLRSKVFGPEIQEMYPDVYFETEEVHDGFHGVNEGTIELLDDGRLLCVARTGYKSSPMISAWSKDGGHTWSTPKPMLNHGGVCPNLRKLPNGNLVLVFGARYIGEKRINGDLTALISSDKGETWSEPYVIYSGPGSSYSDIVPINSNTFMVTYAKSAFSLQYLPQYSAVAEYNKICLATLKIK
jgi:hypothetical protein